MMILFSYDNWSQFLYLYYYNIYLRYICSHGLDNLQEVTMDNVVMLVR